MTNQIKISYHKYLKPDSISTINRSEYRVYSLTILVENTDFEVLYANNDLIEKYARYMKVLTNYDANNKENIIKFIENKDTFKNSNVSVIHTAKRLSVVSVNT